MSDAPILTFDAPSKLGKVASVDTSRVLIVWKTPHSCRVLRSGALSQFRGQPLRSS